MPKSQKEDTLSTLATRIFSAMLEDIVMDVTLQSHHETARSRSICAVCKTRSVHAPTHSVASQPLPSRPSTPAGNGSASAGTSTPTKSDGNLYLECVNCTRQIASNRYAPHLSACMGLAASRRGAARGNAVKKQPSEAEGRSTGSPETTISDDGSPTKGKAKGKIKTDLNLKRKRPDSPQLTPNKKQKKQGSAGSPVARIKSEASSTPGSALRSPSKVPSKLRDSSTASVVERSASPSSRFSSPGPDSPRSSSYSQQQSPSITDRGLSGSPAKSLKGHKGHNIVPPKRSPPRQVVDDYLLDDGGDETGSSTDTDSP
ncbi:hypothetical protein K438DRAFT_1085209 [Mycena galopus ATCC 62051]|nr:hypothetical protein K438DRAFT_1085209 [Mycena galopus ATCC 62051]